MSSKEASNNPGLCPFKGQKSGLSGWTRARNYVLSLSLCTDLPFSFILPGDPQSRCYKCNMKQVLYRGLTAVKHCCTKFSRHSDRAPRVCASLVYTHVQGLINIVHHFCEPVHVTQTCQFSSKLNHSVSCTFCVINNKLYKTSNEARLNFVNCHLHGVYCGETGTTLFLVNGETYFQLTGIWNFRITSFLFQTRKCHCMALRLMCVVLWMQLELLDPCFWRP